MSDAVIIGVASTLLFRRSSMRILPVETLIILFLSPFFSSCLMPMVGGKLLPDIYWNSSNRIFRMDNTDHVFAVRIRDRVDIKCPKYEPKTVFDPNQVEYSEIYSVPRWDYDNCMLTPNAKIVGVCRSPFHESLITVVFREFTPLPSGLEFAPGRSYYFISTSNGSQTGLSNRQGGLCETKNMKLKFEVHSLDADLDNVDDSASFLGPEDDSPADVDDEGYIDTKPVNTGNSNNNRADHKWPVETNERLSSQNVLPATAAPQMSTTTSIWYEIHTRDPDDNSVDNKNQHHVKNGDSNLKENEKRKPGGSSSYDSDDHEASGRKSGASQQSLVNNLLLLTLTLFYSLCSSWRTVLGIFS